MQAVSHFALREHPDLCLPEACLQVCFFGDALNRLPCPEVQRNCFLRSSSSCTLNLGVPFCMPCDSFDYVSPDEWFGHFRGPVFTGASTFRMCMARSATLQRSCAAFSFSPGHPQDGQVRPGAGFGVPSSSRPWKALPWALMSPIGTHHSGVQKRPAHSGRVESFPMASRRRLRSKKLQEAGGSIRARVPGPPALPKFLDLALFGEARLLDFSGQSSLTK